MVAKRQVFIKRNGVPPELFQAIAAERNLTFDWDGYREAMREHETISGAGEKGELFKTGPIESLKEALRRTEFVGYEATDIAADVKGIVVGSADEERLVGRLSTSDAGEELVRGRARQVAVLWRRWRSSWRSRND